MQHTHHHNIFDIHVIKNVDINHVIDITAQNTYSKSLIEIGIFIIKKLMFKIIIFSAIYFIFNFFKEKYLVNKF